MESSRLLALGIFSSYFLIITGLFCLILATLPSSAKRNGSQIAVYTFGVLTLVSFAHTWYYMFGFMTWSFHNFEQSASTQSEIFFERLTNWLRGTELFEQAWKIVCAGPLNWWWSEQLCLFTVGAWTVFLSVQGRRYGIKYLWAYMLLGQVVAISVASNLFYLAICLSAPPPRSEKSITPFLAPPGLWVSILLSLITIGISPLTSERTFLPNLLVMHALLIVPLFSSAPTRLAGKNAFSIRVRTLYSLITIFALVLRLRTIMSVLSYIPQEAPTMKTVTVIAWGVLHSHPAQSSIGWDVIWTSISFFVWKVIGPRIKTQDSAWSKLLPLATSTLVASVGVSAADDWRKEEGDEGSNKEE